MVTRVQACSGRWCYSLIISIKHKCVRSCSFLSAFLMLCCYLCGNLRYVVTNIIVSSPHHAMFASSIGAGVQNGSSDAKKQSSSSQSESNLLEDQQESLTTFSSDQPGMSSGLNKSSSSGSIPSSSSQRQQSRSVRTKDDRFVAVKERRRQLEEKRKRELERQMSEKDRRRQRVLEMKRNPTSSRLTSTRLTPKKGQEVPLISVDSPSPDPIDPGKVGQSQRRW